MRGLGAKRSGSEGGSSLATMRLRARAPRIAFFAAVALLALAGLRGALAPAEPASPGGRVVSSSPDLAAWSFAEAFTRVYLSWEAGREAEREGQLESFLPESLPADGGLEPGEGSSQEVLWTAVTGSERVGDRDHVVVTARTSGATLQLSVPVERNERGFLYVSGYPAIVGPPIVDSGAEVEEGPAVEDPELVAVVERATGNYLAQSTANLVADLAPEAVVTLPAVPLQVLDVDAVTWVIPQRRVAVELEAEDPDGTTWTLRYELSMRKGDRWYVRSLQVNPTFQGGS